MELSFLEKSRQIISHWTLSVSSIVSLGSIFMGIMSPCEPISMICQYCCLIRCAPVAALCSHPLGIFHQCVVLDDFDDVICINTLDRTATCIMMYADSCTLCGLIHRYSIHEDRNRLFWEAASLPTRIRHEFILTQDYIIDRNNSFCDIME